MNTSYIRNMKNIESNSVDSWYNVCYCVPFRHMDFKETRCDTTRFAYNKLRLDSLGGWGQGNLYFVNDKDQLVVLDWRQIISMIPIPTKE